MPHIPVSPARTACTLYLAYRAPFAWDVLQAFLALRGAPQVEGQRQHAYVRALVLRGCSGWVAIMDAPRRHALCVRCAASLEPVETVLRARLRHWFDLDADPLVINAQLARDVRLKPSLRAWPGLRVPGAFDSHELALRAILGQQVSVRGATTLYGRFVERFGDVVSTPFPGICRSAPLAGRVAMESVDGIASLGLPRRRAQTVKTVSTAVADGSLTLERGADSHAVRAQLQALPGIGPWTAQYIAMRALGDADAFPASDLGVLHALGVKTAREAEAASQVWRPWRAYAAMHLWHAAASGG